jgi:hypothetical protein
MDFGSVQSLVGTKIEATRQHLIMSVQYGFISLYSRTFGTEFKEGQLAVHRPYRTDSVQSLLGT